MSTNMPSPIPEMVTKTLLCVDNVAKHDFTGRIYNPYMPQCVPFCGVNQILEIVQGFCDSISFPQSTYTLRGFDNEKTTRKRKAPAEIIRHFPDDIFTGYSGACATFIFTVQFRRHAEWQGVIEWVEAKQTYNYESTLQLFRILERSVESVLEKPMLQLW